MDKSIRKRSSWKEREVVVMLEIIRDSRVLQLLHKTKRNRTIYEDVAKEMVSKGYNKTAIQIRGKFKSLKIEYYKAKRSSDFDRECCRFFDILDEILDNRPAGSSELLDKSQMSADACLNEEIFEDGCEEESTNEIIENSFAEISNISNTSSTSPPFKTLKASKKPTYQKIMENFTEEWKQTQNNLIKFLKEQDEKHIANIERIMDTNRNEMRKIMEEDRRESAKMFSSLLNSFHNTNQDPIASWHYESSPHYDDNEMVEDESALVSTPQLSPMVKPEPNE
ncbi:uncharacterized protein LOC117781650 [Drosophila innubila]|uniref:uncharacterized protein LOC117781650 n=1 Tax=Drosophila innubila TaxID=198719 RepID=UPI00148C5B24|nr:uncharacterized protein LOC117781650 [Drosophila innubila]